MVNTYKKKLAALAMLHCMITKDPEILTPQRMTGVLNCCQIVLNDLAMDKAEKSVLAFSSAC